MTRTYAAIICILLARPSYSAALPEKADALVNYRIDVRLDPAKKMLAGTERISWRNPSGDAVPDLWFHLYLNAFKNTKSTFFRESGGQVRGDELTAGKWGWIRVDSLRLSDGTELAGKMAFVQPDDGNADDQTVMRVLLPQPVPASGTVTLDIAFTAQLPQVFARTGYRHDYYLVGQWFPKLGVYEPAGLRGRTESGWNCHQFHATSEFYADFGQFSVQVTVPSNFVVGATGECTARRTNPDNTVRYTYEQSDIHDFAWTASPHFVEVKRMFRAAEQVSATEYAQVGALLGRSLEDIRLSDVEVTLLMQPGHMDQVERHASAAMAGIKYYGLWYGRYPYRTLTVVDPGTGASGSGGMEYPTFITAGTSFAFSCWPFDRIRLPEAVTIHEFGHQFWYAMVGNNEFEEAWLDEGINSYSTGRVMERVYGKGTSIGEFLSLKFSELDTIRMQNSPNARFNTILAPAWKYTPLSAYGFYSYTKPEIVLRTLENYLGEQTTARIMRTFQERWRFRHPASHDFFALANEISGRDLGWYFDQTMRGTDVLDYEIGSTKSEESGIHYGVFDAGGRMVELTRKEAEKKKTTEAAKKSPEYETEVVVRRRGEVRFPVEVEFKFEGQAPERRQWDGNDRTVTFRFTRPQRLEWVNVDPDRKVELDVDWLNNGRRVKGDGRVSTRLGATWMFLVQNLLALVGI